MLLAKPMRLLVRPQIAGAAIAPKFDVKRASNKPFVLHCTQTSSVVDGCAIGVTVRLRSAVTGAGSAPADSRLGLTHGRDTIGKAFVALAAQRTRSAISVWQSTCGNPGQATSSQSPLKCSIALL